MTSLDVAAVARVSQSTVSKALRNEPGIRTETRMRVVCAAEELGYQVDARASGLRNLRADCIAVVVVCETPQNLADEFGDGVHLLPILQREIHAIGFDMLLSVQHPTEPQCNFVQRGRAQTSIVIGRPAIVQQWNADILKSDGQVQFRFAGLQDGNWAEFSSFSAWLGDAVFRAVASCSVLLDDRVRG